MRTLVNGVEVIHNDLKGLKKHVISTIKKQASDRILSLEGDGRWRVLRAERRSRLGDSSELDKLDNDIESITLLSDQAEIKVNSLNSIEDIKSFTW